LDPDLDVLWSYEFVLGMLHIQTSHPGMLQVSGSPTGAAPKPPFKKLYRKTQKALTCETH